MSLKEEKEIIPGSPLYDYVKEIAFTTCLLHMFSDKDLNSGFEQIFQEALEHVSKYPPQTQEQTTKELDPLSRFKLFLNQKP